MGEKTSPELPAAGFSAQERLRAARKLMGGYVMWDFSPTYSPPKNARGVACVF